MKKKSLRLDCGNQIDRSRPLSFSFDGEAMPGFQGDTVASALMANGVKVIARSFKYHRPRGFFGAGSEDPSAIVTIGSGARSEPNLVASQVRLIEGMVVRSQNRWPSLKWDIGALNGLIAPLLPSGFYNKTFMWPAWAWQYYERMIRNVAGFGVSPDAPDPDSYSKRYCHCDLLVIGAGPAGLSAALEAAKDGKRVILCDEGHAVGGSLADENAIIKGRPGHYWASDIASELSAMPNVSQLYATTVFGWYDHNYLMAVTRHGEVASSDIDRQSLLKIRAGKVILASGAIERSLLFNANDKPGVMLCSAVRRYISRYGVKPGKRAVIYTNNDSGYGVIGALAAAGIEIKALVDRRVRPSPEAAEIARQHEVEIMTQSHVVSARGLNRVSSVVVSSLVIEDLRHKIPCDLVCVSGGWTPSTHLVSQCGGKLRFDDELQTLVADTNIGEGFEIVGSAAGQYGLAVDPPLDELAVGSSPVESHG
jgi:sarcosine oxidase subunit alpha